MLSPREASNPRPACSTTLARARILTFITENPVARRAILSPLATAIKSADRLEYLDSAHMCAKAVMLAAGYAIRAKIAVDLNTSGDSIYLAATDLAHKINATIDNGEIDTFITNEGPYDASELDGAEFKAISMLKEAGCRIMSSVLMTGNPFGLSGYQEIGGILCVAQRRNDGRDISIIARADGISRLLRPYLNRDTIYTPDAAESESAPAPAAAP